VSSAPPLRRARLLCIAGAAGVLAVLAALTVPAAPALADDPTYSFFGGTGTPEFENWEDATPNELGIKFKSDVDGVVTALRFYKGDKNIGTHTGSLWNPSGDLLGSATFAGETASGWQTVTFATPVPITAGSTYIASYYTAVGFYSVTKNEFYHDGRDSGPLHIPKGGAVYRKGSAGFPNTAEDHNYWVDIVFVQQTHTNPSPSASASSATPSVSASISASASASASSDVPGGSGGGDLPATGANVVLMVVIGVLLVSVGTVLVLRYRRRTAKFVA
jgi:LPXTG-motif cell wall-anchored protein